MGAGVGHPGLLSQLSLVHMVSIKRNSSNVHGPFTPAEYKGRVAIDSRTSRRKVVFIEKETSYVDTQEAAKMLGVNKRAVRNLVACRQLESKRDEAGGAAARLLVSVASLEKLRSERWPNTV
jgi:hypothetical protein